MNESHQVNTFRNIGIALLAIWLSIVLYSILYQLAGMLTIHDFNFRLWAQIRGITFYMWTPWLLMAPVVYVLAQKFPIRPDGGGKIIIQHVLLMSALALIHAFAASIIYYSIGDFDPGMENYAAWQHTGHYLFMNDMYLMDCFVYCVLMASISLKHFYELAHQKELDAERAQTQLLESQLQTLKMQVNPHFLFNTLNSIAVLIRKKDARGAEQMLNRLADFFRLTLEQSHNQFVSVREEIQLIQQYLEIEKIRFGERLAVEFMIEDNCQDEKIPVLILQPLVENAIKHGLGKKTGKCLLQIIIKKTATGLSLNVIDNGAGSSATMNGVKKPEQVEKPEQVRQSPLDEKTQQAVKRKRIGIGNIQARLSALYANKASFSFISEPGKGAMVNIFLPVNNEYTKAP